MATLTWPQLAAELIDRHAAPGDAERLHELYARMITAAKELGRTEDAEQVAYISLFQEMAGESSAPTPTDEQPKAEVPA